MALIAPTTTNTASRPVSSTDLVVGLVAIGAAIGAALTTDAAPTAVEGIDAAYRALFAAGFVVFTSNARRWTWLVAGAVPMALGQFGLPLLLGTLAMLLAFVSVLLDRRHPVVGAAVGACSALALLGLPDAFFHGFTLLAGFTATACVGVSGYRLMRSRARRRIRWTLVGAAGFVALAAVGAATAGLLGAGDASRADDAARDGLAAAREGDVGAARDHFLEARQAFVDAADAFDSWYARPARFVPILGQQLGIGSKMAMAGRGLATSAGDAATRADYGAIAIDDGRIDLDAVRALADPLDEAAAAVDRAQDLLAPVDTSWAVPPLRSRFDSFTAQLEEADDAATLAAEAVAVAPDLLGGDGTRRYFVAFLTPSEARGLGGFMGSWAVLTAEDGRLEMTESGRSADLRAGPDDERVLEAPSDYVARYGGNRPELDPRDVSLGPDFPSDAQVYASIYRQATGVQVDGVLALDPKAVAALLQITGPVDLPDFDVRLDADNAEAFLLNGQYLDFPDRAQRVDLLEQAGRAAFDKLLARDDLSPRKLAKVFAPIAEERRFLASATDPEAQALFERIGVDGSFRAPADRDFFAAITQNAANNKIDYYLRRSIDYQASIDEATGVLDATATIRLRNEAPADGLPDYVIGHRDDQDVPDGTNVMELSVYSPHLLLGAEVDGTSVAVEPETEFGLRVYSVRLAVPPSGQTEVRFHLRGTAAATVEGVEVRGQPLAVPDEVTVSLVRAPDGG